MSPVQVVKTLIEIGEEHPQAFDLLASLVRTVRGSKEPIEVLREAEAAAAKAALRAP